MYLDNFTYSIFYILREALEGLVIEVDYSQSLCILLDEKVRHIVKHASKPL